MLTKKLFAAFGLVLAILFIGKISALAQQAKTTLYAEPKRVMLKGDKQLAEGEEEDERDFLRSKFFPIGFSRDGKFAYLVEPPDEACGCYFASLIIQDLRTDKILWKDFYEGVEGGAENLQAHWKKNQKRFSAKLAEYGIVAQKGFQIKPGAFAYGKDTLTPDLQVNMKGDGSDVGVTGNILLQLNSRQKGKKKLFEYVFNPDKHEFLLDAYFSGSLVSPFEPRAALIVMEIYRGYEGPPHTVQINIVGADLEKSFKK